MMEAGESRGGTKRVEIPGIANALVERVKK